MPTRQVDGIKFKDIQLALPINRQKAPFKGLLAHRGGQRATELRKAGTQVDLLNPITIKDKLGTVALFFAWAKARDSTVVNPVAEQRVQLRRNKRNGKKRHPWTIEELNRMFAAPIFTGCRSARNWKQPGNVVLRQVGQVLGAAHRAVLRVAARRDHPDAGRRREDDGGHRVFRCDASRCRG